MRLSGNALDNWNIADEEHYQFPHNRKAQTMASKDNLTDKEREELGVNIENPQTFPENVSPVIKANLMEEHRKKEGLVAAQDQPTAIEVGNQLARERAAADGDKDMQKLLATEQADADKQAQATAEAAPKPDTAETTQNKQQTSGQRRQGDVNKQ